MTNDENTPDVPEAPDGLSRFLNDLFGTVLRAMAVDDQDLATLWFERMQEAGGWYITPPVDGSWRHVTVDGDLFAKIAVHPDPGTFLVRVMQRGRTHELTIRTVPDDGGAV